ncbi:MAG TPA: VWA domain-containing protein [Vicinamibacterales bacterium]|nr:VWA domain-containing protein [Vicinamibacterales bacterium]
MTRLMAALALVAAIDTAGARPQPPGKDPASLLLIDAVAFDRDGRTVADLSRDDLEVWIAGYRVPIEMLTAVTPANAAEEGRSIVLVLDDITLEPPLVSRVRDIARRFVDRILPGDEMAIVPLSGGTMEPSGDRARLLRAIDAYNARAIGVIPFDSLGQQVLTTVASISRQLAQPSVRRKTIVGIGAAWLFDTPIPPPLVGRDLRPEWVDAMRAAALAPASLYVIDPGGVGMLPVTSGTSGFARETGGHAFVNTNDVDGAADRILREAGHYYLIGVADPPVQRKADLRELDVRSKRRGVTIRARRAIPGAS